MTGSLQIKNGKFYMVINTYENGKRKMKWVATGLSEKGNKRKAEQMLRDTLHQYEKEAISPKQRGSEIRCAYHILSAVYVAFCDLILANCDMLSLP